MAAIVQIKSDPHSPGEFRVKGTLANQAGFYEAFDIKAHDVPQQTAWMVSTKQWTGPKKLANLLAFGHQSGADFPQCSSILWGSTSEASG